MATKAGRKGLSAVVATVLLMLITIVAVIIISQVLVPFVKTSLNTASECVNYWEYFVFDDSFGYSCYDDEENNGITLTASGEERQNNSIVGFDLVFNKGVESQKSSARSGAPIGELRMLDGSITNIKIPKRGETLSYVYYNNGIAYESVDVYPVIKSRDGERICEKSDSIKLKRCDSGVSLTN